MKRYGKVVEKRETDVYTLITADMGGAFDVVFREGSLIGGVSMVESQSIAEKAALDLLAVLRDKD
jgi:translation initiation factor IF-3